MRLNVFHAYFPPAVKAGGPPRSLQALCEALDNAVDIRVFCSGKDLDGSSLPVVTNQFVKPVENKKYQVCYSPKVFKLIREILGADCSYVNGIYSLPYNLMPLLFAGGKRVLSVRGMLAPQALEKKKLKKRLYLFLLKGIIRLRPVVFHATSRLEETDIRRVFGNSARCYLIPNLSGFSGKPQLTERTGTLKLGTIALISPMKNHLRVLEAIEMLDGELEYHIWGTVMDADYWQTCQEKIAQLPDGVKVFYHGHCLHEEIAGNLAQLHVVVQPSESENFGHSLVEALVMGRPIITSHHTPWNELAENKAGINVNVEASEIAGAIAFFRAMNATELMGWGKGAMAYISNRNDDEGYRSNYLKLFGVN